MRASHSLEINCPITMDAVHRSTNCADEERTAMTDRKGMRIPLIALILTCLFILGGCNTVSGLGQDLQAAGEGLDQTAERKKGY
jgi:predicted small secreted protein